jgi:hypothetical protein
VIGLLETTNITIVVDTRPTVTHWFINTGKTPAVEFKGHVSSTDLAPGDVFDSKYADYTKADTSSESSTSILMPGQKNS